MSNHRRLSHFLAWLVAIIWMILIYRLSAQPAYQSGALSMGITESVVEVVETVAPEINLNIDLLEHYIRKNAHFFIYLVLAVLVMNALRKSGFINLKVFGFTLLICVLYASSDEIHQHFVPGRGAQVKDVFIDSIGAIVGIGFYSIIKKFKIQVGR
jgi:VanZ family protein